MRSASSSYAGRASSDAGLDELARRSRPPKRVECDVLRDREHPGAQVLAVLEPAVGAERPQERLLERVLGPIGAEPTAEKPEHLAAVLLVEALERGDRHGLHHPRQTLAGRRFVSSAGMSAAVVGHVEWLEFVPVEHVPRPGEIVHAAQSWEQAAGGGSSPRCSSRKLADSVDFFTALGNDEHGRLARDELEARGITVHATRGRRAAAQRLHVRRRRGRAHDHDDRPEAPSARPRRLAPVARARPLRRRLLLRRRRRRAAARPARARPRRDRARARDAPAGIGRARCARLEREGRGGAATSPGRLDPEPRLVVTTSGALGGWAQPGGPYSAAPLPPDPADAYGAGDCFAAGLAFALGAGLEGLDGARLRRSLRRGRARRPGRARGGGVRCRRPEWGAGVARWGKVE